MVLTEILKSTKSSDTVTRYAICHGHYFSQAWSLIKYFYPQQHRNIIIWEAALARIQHNIEIKHALCIFHMVYVTTHLCIVRVIAIRHIKYYCWKRICITFRAGFKKDGVFRVWNTIQQLRAVRNWLMEESTSNLQQCHEPQHSMHVLPCAAIWMRAKNKQETQEHLTSRNKVFFFIKYIGIVTSSQLWSNQLNKN